jgi:hypothetical protein
MTTELTVSPSVLDDLAILPSFVTAGQTCTGFVGLSGTAPPGGAIVRLSSRNTKIATAPAGVVIPARESSANFVISTPTGHTNGVSVISATYRGTIQETITVSPQP